MYLCRVCASECKIPGYCQKCSDDYREAVASGDRPDEISTEHFNYFVWEEVTIIRRKATNGEISSEEADRQISERAAMLEAYYKKHDEETKRICERRRLYSGVSSRQLRDRR